MLNWDKVLVFLKDYGAFVAALIAALASLYNTYNIVRLNLKAKLKELKFSNLIKEQIDKTKELYSLLSDLHRAGIILLTSNPELWDIAILKKKIVIWDTLFRSSFLFYNRNKILFTREMRQKLDSHFDDLLRIRNSILSHRESISQEEEYALHFYTQIEAEYEFVKGQIKKMNESNEVQWLISKSEKIRKSLENYFDKLLE